MLTNRRLQVRPSSAALSPGRDDGRQGHRDRSIHPCRLDRPSTGLARPDRQPPPRGRLAATKIRRYTRAGPRSRPGQDRDRPTVNYAVDDRASGATTPPLIWYEFATDRTGAHPSGSLPTYRPSQAEGLLETTNATIPTVSTKWLAFCHGAPAKTLAAGESSDRRIRADQTGSLP